MIKLFGVRDFTVDPLIAEQESPLPAATTEGLAPSPGIAARRETTEQRLQKLAEQLERVWRFVRRMGLSTNAAEDIAHECFLIAAARIDTIVPGKERAFLMAVAMNKTRREHARGTRHEELTTEPTAPLMDQPDELVDEERARRALDATLAMLDDDLRVVFVLHELEEQTMAEIAQLLDLPPGTVASRLRRAREQWRRAVDRIRRKPTGGA